MPRSEAQRAAFERLRPKTAFFRLRYDDDPRYRGVVVEHRGLGIQLRSTRAFYDPDGVLYLEGVVVDPGATGIRVGCVWAAPVDRLRKAKERS